MPLTLDETRELMRGGLNGSNGTSLVVGKQYLIRAVTHYYTGRLVAITDTDLVLEDAAWVPDTGRFHDCLKNGTFNEVEPFVDRCIVFRGGLIDATEIKTPLPRSQKSTRHC